MSRADPIAVVSRMVRVASAAALQQLGTREQAVVALLARAPGIDRHLLDKLGGAGFVDRAIAAGIPLRRQVTGALDLASASAFRSGPVDPETASQLAASCSSAVGRWRPSGCSSTPASTTGRRGMMMGLSESITDTVEPRQMLSLLARLGPTTDRQPALLLLRASATEALGRVDEAGRRHRPGRGDGRRRRAGPAPARGIESARARLAHGRRDEAARIAEQTLAELGDGESRTYARAHEVLAECAATSDAREDLQRAAESYRVAAAAWESCGEFARARGCRRDLAMGVLRSRSAASTRRWRRSASCSARRTCPTPSARGP